MYPLMSNAVICGHVLKTKLGSLEEARVESRLQFSPKFTFPKTAFRAESTLQMYTANMDSYWSSLNLHLLG